MSDPRLIGDVVRRALDGLETTEQARAYSLWARAAGLQIAAAATPRRFSRGTLTVECESSVWSSELTYLGGAILEKMRALDPAQPVERLKFVLRRTPRREVAEPAVSNNRRSGRRLATGETADARASAESVRDEGLRAAIKAALAASLEGPREDPA
jgi:hypothetical protein